MADNPRLIEKAFLLRQVSLDSVHEKNAARQGHIGTLHLWPARRPLAACRAALITTLLDDPGSREERDEMLKRMAGELAKDADGKQETRGGILHWKRETENSEGVSWFRNKIREQYGRAPKVFDPFAGGGAIPLEAMRLGCETTAIDINPVAWFVLKCTLDYPHRFAGKLIPLPEFVRQDYEFLLAWCGRQIDGKKPSPKRVKEKVGQILAGQLRDDPHFWDADISWHLRAWGRWVLLEARRDLALYYPTYAEWQPPTGWGDRIPTPPPEPQREDVEMADGRWFKPAPSDAQGAAMSSPDLNHQIDPGELADPRKPRWVVKPTIAYQWARTVRCQNSLCRAEIPLLSTTWLINKRESPAYLKLSVNPDTLAISIEPITGREPGPDDIERTVGGGGARCPACTLITKDSQIRHEFSNGRGRIQPTAVVVQGPQSKEFRRPLEKEKCAVQLAKLNRDEVLNDLPYGDLNEDMPQARRQGNTGFRVLLYGYTKWKDLFEDRQAISLATLARIIRTVHAKVAKDLDVETANSICAYLSCILARVVDRSTNVCRSDPSPTQSGVINTFSQFNIPMNFDFIESAVVGTGSGSMQGAIEWVAKVVEHCLAACEYGSADVQQASARSHSSAHAGFDLILTDPPYYDSFAYGDISDVFLAWHRRVLGHLSPEFAPLDEREYSPKADEEDAKAELIADAGRFGGDRGATTSKYEEGMREAFSLCYSALSDSGRLVIVFANKNPEAWEALVTALIRAGFLVTASWPIETEMGNRTRANAAAALASSIWVVCRRRDVGAKAGWDNEVLQRMGSTITASLREFWDIGIRGPDFVWSAVGPALEEYSRHPVVKKTAGQGVLTVKEFLEHVRRMVVDFVVGRVFQEGHVDENQVDVAAIDDVTAYYLLHRYDFGFETAPIGACILYAISCGTTDTRLAGAADILVKPNKKQSLGEDDESDDPEGDDKKKSNMVRLKRFNERTKKDLGEREEGEPMPPLIDRVHRLMLLWKAGDQDDVNEYVADMGLQHDRLFLQLMQALVELSRDKAPDESQILEAAMNHLKRNGNIQAPTRTGDKLARPGKKVKIEHPTLFDPDELSTVREPRKGYGNKKR